jgi:hypothetical protein
LETRQFLIGSKKSTGKGDLKLKTATKKAVALVSALSMAAMLSLVFSFSAFAAGSPINVTLNAVHGSSATGTASITDNGDGTMTVVVNVTGLDAGSHLAHIHTGSCAAEGGVKFPLNNVTVDASGKGTSTTTVKAPVSALAGGSYYVNVHQSGAGVPPGAACGDIPTSAIASSGSSSGTSSSAGGQGGASSAPTSAPATGFGGTADNSQLPVNFALIAVLAMIVAGSSFALVRSRKSR